MSLTSLSLRHRRLLLLFLLSLRLVGLFVEFGWQKMENVDFSFRTDPRWQNRIVQKHPCVHESATTVTNPHPSESRMA